jgi:hypothetical protein
LAGVTDQTMPGRGACRSAPRKRLAVGLAHRLEQRRQPLQALGNGALRDGQAALSPVQLTYPALERRIEDATIALRRQRRGSSCLMRHCGDGADPWT